MLDVYREEKKYKLSTVEMAFLRAKLTSTMKGDSFNGTNSYIVRSLYFDSIQDTDFFEKKDGVNERKKIRLRIYDPDSKTAKLELKAKCGSMQRKRSLTISKDDAVELIKCNYEVLKKYEDELAAYLYRTMSMELYRPKCVVEYDRIAYCANENETRLTLDTNVRANEGNFDIFSKELLLYPVMNPDEWVLEVKYNGFLLGYIKSIIQCADRVEMSVSKYTMSRRYGLGGE